MSDSPLLTLPYLAAAQAQKHVTHNEALSMIDGLVHLAVNSRVLGAPPVSPVDGDRYLIPAGATGDWTTHPGQVVLRMEGAWRYLTPREGWQLWVSNEDALLTYDGSSWIAASAPTSLQNVSLLGVNATADTTNKLSVASPAVLFNNTGTNVQIKLNKNAVSDSASFHFQTGFSGRAEIGITGDDNFHFKVSSNGSAFNESLIVTGSSGLVTIKNGIVLDPAAADPATPSNGQLWYNSTTSKLRARQNGASVDVIGGGTPGGTSGQIQYNNAGALAGLTINGDATLNAGTGALTIANSAVTFAKMSNLAANSIIGNNTGAAAAPVALTAAQVKSLLAITSAEVSGLGALATAGSVNLSTQATGTLQAAQEPAHTGDVANPAGSLALTIASNAVTNAKAAQMAATTIKANVTGATANATDATPAQVTAILPTFVASGPSAAKGLVPAPSTTAGTAAFLREDGTWATPAAGGGGETNTASNINTGGVGVFKQKTGVNLEFRGVNAGASNNITVTSDAANNEIDIDLVSNVQNLAMLGINATADATNKLSVSSSAVLLNNIGSGVQVKVNKNAAANTASFLFQTGFSGRAEIGTTGDDDFHFKVSANGTTYFESLWITGASGLMTAKNGFVFDPAASDPTSPVNGQLWYNSTTGKFRGRQAGASIDIVSAAGGGSTDYLAISQGALL